MDSLNRHEQLLRLFHIIDILFSARHPLPLADIREKLRSRGAIEEMSDKNLRRDIEFLERFGYAIKQSRERTERGRSRLAWAIESCRGAGELPAPAVTLPELLSLAVAQDLLAPLAGTVYWRGVSQVLAKLEQVATPQLREYLAEHRDGLVVHPRPGGAKYRAGTLSAINRGIRGCLELEICYTSLASSKPRRQRIRPEALVLYDGAIYIAARRGEDEAPAAAKPAPGAKRARGSKPLADSKPAAATKAAVGGGAAAGGVRFFKLDRISAVEVTARRFVRGRGSIEGLLADSITLFRAETPPRRYRIRVDAALARWACEKPFHPRQDVLPEADGGVILLIERAWDDELVPQLLGLGDHAEVLEPEDVRARIAATARRIAARYEPASASATRASSAASGTVTQSGR